MEWLIIILLAANLALLAFFYFRNQKPQDSQGLMLLQNQVQDLARLMGEGTKFVYESTYSEDAIEK